MNKSKIKTFAVWARQTLLKQVKDRAALFGITAKGYEAPDHNIEDAMVFHGVVYHRAEKEQYRDLVTYLEELKRGYSSFEEAFEKLIDEAAYTWFNRLTALRFMEVKEYIPRVLSSSTPGSVDPDILRDAIARVSSGELSGITPEEIDRLRSQNKTSELYNQLLIAQCSALGDSLPFLFKNTAKALALLLPHNLLHQESIVRKMVNDIPEEDWQEVEIVGWLYQYYISERKDIVVNAIKKSKILTKDIPAATQLFTPHWIVKYMVQNSLGKLWMEAHPNSKLKEQMEFYLSTPEQTPEVQQKINQSINPNLTPEELTVIDPACGSGHILTYAFDLLFEIYKERGYSERDIPELILTKNLYGLDIDERAAQLASFAVLMKAREKNRRILREGRTPKLNLLAIQHTRGLSTDLKTADPEIYEDWEELIKAFRDADTLGSLIEPPPVDIEKLEGQIQKLEAKSSFFTGALVPELKQLLETVKILRQKYAVVVANPPYMGNKGLNNVLKAFFEQEYKDYKSDLFAVCLIRFRKFSSVQGHLGFMTPLPWMFIKSYEQLRKSLISESVLSTLIQPEYNTIWELAHIPICTFTMRNKGTNERGEFIRLVDFYGAENQPIKALEAIENPNCGYRYQASSEDFEKIPGSPIAYWVSDKILTIFETLSPLKQLAEPKVGLQTGSNDIFLRYWYEINHGKFGLGLSSGGEALQAKLKWFPYNKGGDFRRWYGNQSFVVNWLNDGAEIKRFGTENGGQQRSVIRNPNFYFTKSISWSKITSSYISLREYPKGFLFDVAGCSLFSEIPNYTNQLLGLLNSNVGHTILSCMSPTLNFEVGQISNFPLRITNKTNETIKECVNFSKQDWDNFETSWDFQTHPLTRYNTPSLQNAFTQWQSESEQNFKELQRLEEENNKYWIEAYSLQDELTPEVPDEQITIRKADLDRDMRSFISYAVGNMMGRYSLDEPGLIHAGQTFDPSRHQTFPAEADAIIPINDQGYFENDMTSRFIDFLKASFGAENLNANLDFIAEALERKKNESSEERIRRYFLSEFVKDHNQVYKKRPIYWLFTSGKKRAFNAFVYLHRYSKDTLSKLRTEYLHELQSKLEAQLEQEKDIELQATSATDKKKASKRTKELKDQIAELKGYDEKLRHLADKRIELDLDDGVAYNYTLFEGLVYEGADLKMADLKAKSKWKRDLLAEQEKAKALV